jgi:aminopeptidase N
VTHYGLTLSYEPSTNLLTGTAVITATATQNLSSFDLDLRGFSISRLLVSGQDADFARSGEQELVITPRAGLSAGTVFTVVIDYAGAPAVVTDPDQSIEGWVPTDDGAFVVGEPQGSPAWYPVNDNPRDKATFDFSITVPAELTAMANGVLVSNRTASGRTTWVWQETDPMAPYLASATLGQFDLTISTTSGIPTYVAVDPQLPKGQVLNKLPAAVDFFTSIYGPYPFNAVGAVVDSAKEVGYSLETQTKPVFDRMPNEATLVHEISHMWYGDSVTLTTWPDIWLHEGFATWSEWIWSEYQGNKSAAQWFKQLYNTPAQDIAFWTPPPGDPGTPVFLFNGTIYYRGAMTLEALREKIGDDTFFTVGHAESLRQRDDSPVHRPRRAAQRDGPDALLRRLAVPTRQAHRLVDASVARGRRVHGTALIMPRHRRAPSGSHAWRAVPGADSGSIPRSRSSNRMHSMTMLFGSRTTT